MSPTPAAPLVVVMGVAGAGKTTLGTALAQRLRVPFVDADDFHDPRSVAQMAAGVPLDDTDRLPWLHRIGGWLGKHTPTGGVATCSALKRTYRDILREHAPTTLFAHLHGTIDVVQRRMANRTGHFMPTSLARSQFATLEPLDTDEAGYMINLDNPVDALVDTLLGAIGHPTPPELSDPGTTGEPT